MDQQPVACTLRPADFADRSEAWRELLRPWSVDRSATPEGGHLMLQGAPGVADTARELAELEAECCAWMTIRVEEGEQVMLTITSTRPGGPETIRELFQIAG